MTLSELALFSDDVESARRFYERVLGASPVAEWPGGAIYVAGAAKVLLHERAGAMPDGPPNEDHFAIAVDDLDAVCETLRSQGTTLLVDPRDYSWGRSAYLRDPDGRLVELAQS